MYTLKVINKTQQAQRYRIELVGEGFALQGLQTLDLAPGEISDAPYSVTLIDDGTPTGTRQLRFTVTDTGDPQTRDSVTSTFVAPIGR